MTTSLNRSRYNGNVILSAKQNGLLVGRTTYNVTNGVLSLTTSTADLNYAYPDTQKNVPIDLEVYVSDPVLIEVLTTYPKLGALNINYEITDSVTDPALPAVMGKSNK